MEEYKYLGCVVDEYLSNVRMVEERAKAGAKALSDWLRRCRATVGEVKGATFVRLLEMMLLYVTEFAKRDHALRGNVNIWVQDKTRAKPPIHAIADYCIIGTYCVSPIFRPSLKPVRLSCVSNEDQIVSLCRSLWPCTEMIIRGRPDFKYIHGHYASLVMFRKKLQTASETTSVPLYNLHNH